MSGSVANHVETIIAAALATKSSKSLQMRYDGALVAVAMRYTSNSKQVFHRNSLSRWERELGLFLAEHRLFLRIKQVIQMSRSDVNKVVLAYSGGLDTSIIVKWLQDVYQCEVVTFTADIGQGEEVAPARAKAEAVGIKEIYIEDLREEFVRDYVFPMFRANALYEGEYLLGTSIARPLIAKRLVEIAKQPVRMPSRMVPRARATTRSDSNWAPMR